MSETGNEGGTREQWGGSTPTKSTTRGSANVRHLDRIREVYFVQGGEDGLIKIGVTNGVRRRIIAMQTLSPVKLVVLGVQLCPNRGSLESALHNRFAHLRQHGEWFSPGSELLAYIAASAIPLEDVPEARAALSREVPMRDDILRKHQNRYFKSIGRPELVTPAAKCKVRA